MAPLVPRTKNVIVVPTGAAAGPAESTPPRLVHPAAGNTGSPVPGHDALLYHSALSVPRHATVTVYGAVVPVTTAAGPPMHSAAPTGCQPSVSDRTHSRRSVPVPTNSGSSRVKLFGLGAAATAGGPVITPPKGCQPEPSCGASTHNCPSDPSTPTATAPAGGIP